MKTLQITVPDEVGEWIEAQVAARGLKDAGDLVREWALREREKAAGNGNGANGLVVVENSNGVSAENDFADDPMEKFIGAFDSGVTDLGQRHDFYIGQHLQAELRDEEA